MAHNDNLFSTLLLRVNFSSCEASKFDYINHMHPVRLNTLLRLETAYKPFPFLGLFLCFHKNYVMEHSVVSNCIALQIIDISHLQETKFELKMTIFEDP